MTDPTTAAPAADAQPTATPTAGTDAPPAGASGGLPAEPAEQAIRRLEDALAEAQDRHLRLMADFDNFRRRAAKERVETGDRAQAALVLRLLDVLDDMDRLAATDPATTAAGTMREAMALVDRKLRKELEAAGLERIDPAGQPFDPTVHEAVSILPPPAPEQDHVVSATFQTGYRFKGALVRPARVQVFSAEGHA